VRCFSSRPLAVLITSVALLPACGGDDGGLSDAEDDSGTELESTGDATTGDDSDDTGSCEGTLGCPCDPSPCDEGLACSNGACAPEHAVWVPGGAVELGCDLAVEPACQAGEGPAVQTTVSGFALDLTEVTEAAFIACTVDGPCVPIGDDVELLPPCSTTELGGPETADHPVRCVTWAQADSYCTWRGGRLPTEAEWMRAARGEGTGRFPWGDTPDASCETSVLFDPETGSGCGTGGPLPVGSRPQTTGAFGNLDMVGNVRELTFDWYADLPESLSPDPSGPTEGEYRVVLGASFLHETPEDTRLTNRGGVKVDGTNWATGFRCAYHP
jgi:formylglycine-generating enzyme